MSRDSVDFETPSNILATTKRLSEPVDFVFNVVFAGNSDVGKSALLHRMVNDKFDPNTTSTVGLDFATLNVKTDEGHRVRLCIWDTAGQERFRAITSTYFRHAHAVLFVYDVTNANSLSAIQHNWTPFVTRASLMNDELVRVLCGSKHDNPSVVNADDVQQVYEKCAMNAVAVTSALSGENVEDMIRLMTRALVKKRMEQTDVFKRQMSVFAGFQLALQSIGNKKIDKNNNLGDIRRLSLSTSGETSPMKANKKSCCHN